MTARCIFIRHGLTEWNVQGRIQGRTDIRLSEEGLRDLRSRRYAAWLRTLAWVSSPLSRARETAAVLSGKALDEIAVEPRLIEMKWGEWEGALLTDLRRRGGREMADNEARGLDFRPPGGESPTEVQRRVLDWLDDVAAGGEDVVAVTHKGVIRAVLAHAFGWTMTGKPPVRLDWSKAHVFEASGSGDVRPVALNGDGDV